MKDKPVLPPESVSELERLRGQVAEALSEADPDGLPESRVDAVMGLVQPMLDARDAEISRLNADLPQCNDLCLRASDVLDDLSHVQGDPVARAHRSCPQHGDLSAVAVELDVALAAVEVERDRLRLAWESARRGRRTARWQVGVLEEAAAGHMELKEDWKRIDRGVERLMAELAEQEGRIAAVIASITEEQDARQAADATIARVRAANDDMRFWCTPYGIAKQFADHIDRALAEPAHPKET